MVLNQLIVIIGLFLIYWKFVVPFHQIYLPLSEFKLEFESSTFPWKNAKLITEQWLIMPLEMTPLTRIDPRASLSMFCMHTKFIVL